MLTPTQWEGLVKWCEEKVLADQPLLMPRISLESLTLTPTGGTPSGDNLARTRRQLIIRQERMRLAEQERMRQARQEKLRQERLRQARQV